MHTKLRKFKQRRHSILVTTATITINGLKRCHVTAFKIPFINQSTLCAQFKAEKAGLATNSFSFWMFISAVLSKFKYIYVYMCEISTSKFG